MKTLFFLLSFFLMAGMYAQTCYTISNRTNGNGNPGTCGTPACSGNAKTGHIDVSFGASCPGTIPALQLTGVSGGSLPNPFCFDPGNCISPGSVRYCFRGTNLPSSGFMTLKLTQGASVWSCTYSVNGGSGTLLPVELSYFTAKRNNGSVLLKWRTEQELNNKKFDIERSANGVSFTSIGVINGQGTISIPQEYNYTDAAPATGVSFYRLRQEDIDGHFTYSSVKRIDNRMPGIEVNTIYPNPVHGLVNLSITTDKNMLLTAKIYDEAGRQVFSINKDLHSGTQNWQIILPALQAGHYKLMLTGDYTGVITEKLVVL